MALWDRVQSAEREHRAAVARCEAFGVLDPSAGSPEYDEAYLSVGRAWVDAEAARHELDAFLHPRRYARKGHRDEALGEFRARAGAGEHEDRPEAHGRPAVPEPGTRVPEQEGGPDDREQLIDGPATGRREALERTRTEAGSFAPTPFQLGLTANPGLSWEDIHVAQPTPFDLFGVNDPDMSWWEFQAMLDREAEI